jgi:hypothetical protein
MFDRPDPELNEALDLSKSNPQQAAKVLRIAAKYMKSQEKLPSALAIFLSDAFERAMKKPTTARGSELLMNLNLVVANRRPKAHFEYVGLEVEKLLQAKVPKGRAILQAGEIYGIDATTVKRMHNEFIALKASEDLKDHLFLAHEYEHHAEHSSPAKVTRKLKLKRAKDPVPSELDR